MASQPRPSMIPVAVSVATLIPNDPQARFGATTTKKDLLRVAPIGGGGVRTPARLSFPHGSEAQVEEGCQSHQEGRKGGVDGQVVP